MKDDGGPAFPTENERQTGENSYHYAGMTLRDWFAGQAVAGILARGLPVEIEGRSHIPIPEAAYIIADAMIAARA